VRKTVYVIYIYLFLEVINFLATDLVVNDILLGSMMT
jgi:hypothetical protein